MPRLDLLNRTELFALAVFHFCRALPKTKEAQEPADQLRRAANGMRTNYRAARRGRSYAEFKAKLGVVFEEADEAADWLRYFRDTGMRHDQALVREGEGLARIFAASVATARKNSRRYASASSSARRGAIPNDRIFRYKLLRSTPSTSAVREMLPCCAANARRMY